jgi:hypothetical protein
MTKSQNLTLEKASEYAAEKVLKSGIQQRFHQSPKNKKVLNCNMNLNLQKKR